MVPDVGAGWRSQPRGAPTFGVPWVGVPPHGRARVPSPRGGRAVGTSSDSVAVLQGTGTRGSDRRCHPDPPVPPASNPGVTCTPPAHRVAPPGVSARPPRVSAAGPLGFGACFVGVWPLWHRGSAPSPTMADPHLILSSPALIPPIKSCHQPGARTGFGRRDGRVARGSRGAGGGPCVLASPPLVHRSPPLASPHSSFPFLNGIFIVGEFCTDN